VKVSSLYVKQFFMIDPSLLPALFDVATVARVGSVGAASRQLHKTPSAVSQQIRRVERHFGVALFERRGRGLGLSGAGELALSGINRLFDEAEGLFAQIAQLAGSSTTVLRIAASDYLGRALLSPVIRELYEPRAQLRFEITTVHSVEALRAVERGEVDFAVGTVERSRPSLEDHVLLRQPFVWVGPKDVRTGQCLTERLESEPLLRLSPGSEGRRLLDLYIEERRIRVLSTIDVPSVSLMLSYASGGLGIGLSPRLAVEPGLERRLTVEHADVGTLPTRLAYRKGYRLTPVAERFVTRLRTEGQRAARRLGA
jgi:DNA-binding transcriptional LysR family regulator